MCVYTSHVVYIVMCHVRATAGTCAGTGVCSTGRYEWYVPGGTNTGQYDSGMVPYIKKMYARIL